MLVSGLVLNMKNVTNKLKPVTEWYNLGIQLGVPDYLLSQIQSNYSRDICKCKSEMLSYWFRNADDQSWHVIADALEKIDYCKLANEIRRGPSDGMLVLCLDYLVVYRVCQINTALQLQKKPKQKLCYPSRRLNWFK